MTNDTGRVHVGAMRIEVHLPGVSSLKGKRSVLKKAIAALRNDLDVSVAEIGWQDTWQRAALAVAVASGTPAGVERVLDRVVAIVERDPRLLVTGAARAMDVVELDDLDPTAGLLAARGWGEEEPT